MTSTNLSSLQIVLLCMYAFGMTAGQIMFKHAAGQLVASGSVVERVLSLLQNVYFLAAITLYFLLALFWVWLLSFTPLSRAYPFMALAFGLVPVVASLTFGEPLAFRTIAGIVFVFIGIVLVAS